MTLLLDTHILVWWLLDLPLPTAEQTAAIEQAERRGEPLGVASITLWELAKLVELGRIDLKRTVDDVLQELETSPALRILPLSARVAVESTRLGPSFHRDPADQVIAATARVHGLRLVTADRRVRQSGVVSVV